MAGNKLIKIVAALALLSDNVFPALSAAAIYSSPQATPTSSCSSSDIWCGVEASWGRGGYFGRRLNVDTAHQCYDFCNLPRRWGDCESFTWSDGGTCWIHSAPAQDVATKETGVGEYIWDKECWDCGETPTETVPTATPTSICLSPTSVCEVEAKWRGGEDLAPRGTGEGIDYPYGCWELCADPRRPTPCKSFTWEPGTESCLIYDFTANDGHVADPGSGVWLWDADCWTCGVSGYT